MAEVVVELQDSLRVELKEPAGPIFTDVDALLAEAGHPLVTVGDVVSYHVVEAGETPDVALLDDHTERTAVDETIAETLAAFEGFDREVTVANPPGTLTAALLEALGDALAIVGEASTLIVVEGEEDLAALPAIAAAPDGATVVYGQPGEGMVMVHVGPESRAEMLALLDRMTGDTARLRSILGLE